MPAWTPEPPPDIFSRMARADRSREPRAPTQAEWDAMDGATRARVVEALPSEWEELLPPEGDEHREAASDALETLRAFYRSTGRRVYVSSNLGIYYPGEPRFAPDLLAVVDVEPHKREKWVVSAEGKGLDFVMEILVHGDRRKDLEANVARYARLGITEYVIHDVRRGRLLGHRLPSPASATADRYEPIAPEAGRVRSQVLDLDLVLDGERLRFHAGTACLLDGRELVERLEHISREAEARARAETERADAYERKLAEYERRFGKLT